MLKTARFAAVLLGLALLPSMFLAQEKDAVRGVRDEAKLFQQDALDEANSIIAEIRQKHHKDLFVETLTEGPAKNQSAWAVERFNTLGVNGVYIVITTKPKHFELVVGNKTSASGVFTTAHRNEAAKLLQAKLKAGKPNDALIEVAKYVLHTMNEHAGLVGPGGSRLAVIQKAPDWRLIDQNEKEVNAADLDGKVVLLSFMFTTCNGSCPATTHRMEKVQAELAKRGLLKNGGVRLISITLDPARDTPQKLRDYMELYDAEPKSWTFLTGATEDVAQVTAAFGMWARPAANGQLDHPSRIFLIDGRRRVREIYNLSFLRPSWVVEDIELLLKEASGEKQ